MFELEYKGGNGVIISTKKASLVIDPKLSVVGLKDLNVKEAIEVATEARLSVASDDAKLVIEGPGEYGIANFDIRGIAAQRHLDASSDPKISTIYRIEAGGMHVALIGNIYEKITDDQLENIGVVDIVVIPVGGGGYTLDATGATTLVRQIDPKIVVPVHYNEDGLKYEVPQADLDEFVKELGAPLEEVSKLKLKNDAALPAVLTVYKVTRS